MADIEASQVALEAWVVAAVEEVEGYSIMVYTLDNKPWDILEDKGVVAAPEEVQELLLAAEEASLAEEEEHSTQPAGTDQGMVRSELVTLGASLLLGRW